MVDADGCTEPCWGLVTATQLCQAIIVWTVDAVLSQIQHQAGGVGDQKHHN